MFRLFKREAVVSTAKLLDSSVDADKPGTIMTRLQAEVLQEKKREDLRPLLYRVVRRALSDRAVTPALVSQLMEDSRVVEALEKLETAEEAEDMHCSGQIWRQLEELLLDSSLY